MQFKTLKITKTEFTATVKLSRTEVRNAFDDVLIAELIRALADLAAAGMRVLILTGGGETFCAGADLHWMKRMAGFDYEENLEDARRLAELLEVLYNFPGATIARVNGPAIGGGVGLVAACDIAVAGTNAVFSLSEVRLGLVPSCIAPYVIRRIGEKNAREYFLTGSRFDSAKAEQMGLVNTVVDPGALDGEVNKRTGNLLRCGPEAVKSCKELIARSSMESISELKEYTARLIADLRISAEGQEGIRAFFDKRRPAWDKSEG